MKSSMTHDQPDLRVIGRDRQSVREMCAALLAVTQVSPRTDEDPTDLLDAPPAGSGCIAFVDIDPDPLAVLSALEPVAARLASVRFVVVSERFTQDLLVEAMSAGARHFIVKSEMNDELPKVLRRLRAADHASGAGGTVVTVLSAGGGCGATTLAINLAADLPRKEHEPCLIVDLDTAYGTVGTYLGVRGEYGAAQVLDYHGPIDPQLVATTAQTYDEHLHVLLSPASVNFADPAPLAFERIGAALQACRRAYPWVVVDAPRLPMNLCSQLAEQSRQTLIVSQLTVRDVRTARAIHQALVQRGVQASSICHVLNRHRSKRAMISVDDAKAALGDVKVALVRNDYASSVESLNLGKPLAQCAPRSVARRDIRDLAQAISAAQRAENIRSDSDGRRPGLSLVG